MIRHQDKIGFITPTTPPLRYGPSTLGQLTAPRLSGTPSVRNLGDSRVQQSQRSPALLTPPVLRNHTAQRSPGILPTSDHTVQRSGILTPPVLRSGRDMVQKSLPSPGGSRVKYPALTPPPLRKVRSAPSSPRVSSPSVSSDVIKSFRTPSVCPLRRKLKKEDLAPIEIPTIKPEVDETNDMFIKASVYWNQDLRFGNLKDNAIKADELAKAIRQIKINVVLLPLQGNDFEECLQVYENNQSYYVELSLGGTPVSGPDLTLLEEWFIQIIEPLDCEDVEAWFKREQCKMTGVTYYCDPLLKSHILPFSEIIVKRLRLNFATVQQAIGG